MKHRNTISRSARQNLQQLSIHSDILSSFYFNKYREEAEELKMTVRLSTIVSNIEKIVSNEENVQAILLFFEFMKKGYCKFLGPSITLHEMYD